MRIDTPTDETVRREIRPKKRLDDRVAAFAEENVMTMPQAYITLAAQRLRQIEDARIRATDTVPVGDTQ
jgi:hypothetical protein